MISGTGFPTGQLAGTTVANYRVLQPVGIGGMGEVYRGWDDRLGRPVAIKVLHPALATDERARQRFLRETRLACRVVHPYVATVFDVLEKNERLFLVMEYIEGRRLDEVVRADNPPPKEIARLGLEIAEALAAIHDSGLVHRDLKPGNVMVTPAGHVKVMDFGVAYPMGPPPYTQAPDGTVPPSEPTLTQEGHGVGTVSYMSPEQIRGSHPDGRSDLFSLGIVLYEALARQHPFMRGSPLATASAILNEAPGSGTEEPRTLTESGALREIVFRLLEKSPARRYQTAEEVMAELRAVIEGRPLVKPSRWTARATWITTAVLLVAAAAAGGAWWWWSHRSGTTPLRKVIAIIPFDDATGEPDAQVRGAMVADLLAAAAGGDGAVRVVDQDRIADVVAALPQGASRSERVAAVGAAARVDWVGCGTLYRSGSSLEAAVEIWPPAGGAPDRAFRVSAAGTSGLVDAAVGALRRLLVPGEGAGGSTAAAVIRASDEETALLYEKARLARREQRLADAIDFSERAVRRDSSFLPALVLLARSLDEAGFGARARQAGSDLLRAVSRASPARAPRIDLETRAVAAGVTGDSAAALSLLQDIVTRFPDDAEAIASLASAHLRRGNDQAALPLAERAAELDPSWVAPRLTQSVALADLERFDDAARALDGAEAVLAKAPSVSAAAQIASHRGYIAFLRNDRAAAIEAYTAASTAFRRIGLSALAAEAERNLADLEVAEGRLDAAEGRYRSAASEARRVGYRRVAVAALASLGANLYVSNRYPQAERAFREALSEVRELDNPPIALPLLVNLASLLRKTGRLSEGRELALEGSAIARELGDREAEAAAATIAADAEVAEGRLSDAIQRYREVIRTQSETDPSGARLGPTLTSLAEALLSSGDLGGALASAAEGVANARATGVATDLPWALAYRALVEAYLSMPSVARRDLAEIAQKIPPGHDAGKAFARRADFVEGVIAIGEGRFKDAERLFSRASSEREAVAEAGWTVTASALRAHALVALGNPDRAMEVAATALASPVGWVQERAAARVALARALAASRRPRAADEARRAFDEAGRLQARVIVAGAAALVVTAGGVDAGAARARGRDALSELEASVPVSSREAWRRRADLAWMVESLGPLGPSNAPKREQEERTP